MVWVVDNAQAVANVATITLKHLKPDGTDDVDTNGDKVLRRLRHERASFGGVLQTPTQWQANIKREVEAHLAEWDSQEEKARVTTDITGAVR